MRRPEVTPYVVVSLSSFVEESMRKLRAVVLAAALLVTLLSMSCTLLYPRGGALEFEPDELPNAQRGAAYETRVRVTENNTPVGEFWISDGGLPAGLELVKLEGEEDTAIIRGVPEEAGAFTFTVNVWCYGTNVSGQQGEKEYTLLVEE